MSWSFFQTVRSTMYSFFVCLKKVPGLQIVPLLDVPPVEDEGILILILEEVLKNREKRLKKKHY